MTKSEVIKLLAMMSAAYPNMKEVSNLTVDIWYDCLKDVAIETALKAVKKNILESPYPPSISDIRKQVSEVNMPNQLDSSEAWGEVVKAIKKFGYYREKEALESMSPTTSKTVKYMGWQDICHSEKPDVVRGQFLKMYTTVADREKKNSLLPEEFRLQMTSKNENMKQLTDSLGDKFGLN